jgi:CRP-like cAMP-binding protein
VGSLGVLDAAATMLGSRSPKFNQLILWARARADNTPISELCRTWRWPRSSFDQRLEEIAGRVADYLNKRQAETPSQAASSSPLESRDCPRETRLSVVTTGLPAEEKDHRRKFKKQPHERFWRHILSTC